MISNAPVTNAVCIFAFKDTRTISQIIFENWPHRLTLNRFFLAQPFDRERGPDSQGTWKARRGVDNIFTTGTVFENNPHERALESLQETLLLLWLPGCTEPFHRQILSAKSGFADIKGVDETFEPCSNDHRDIPCDQLKNDSSCSDQISETIFILMATRWHLTRKHNLPCDLDYSINISADRSKFFIFP